jgi:hypothetical protein
MAAHTSSEEWAGISLLWRWVGRRRLGLHPKADGWRVDGRTRHHHHVLCRLSDFNDAWPYYRHCQRHPLRHSPPASATSWRVRMVVGMVGSRFKRLLYASLLHSISQQSPAYVLGHWAISHSSPSADGSSASHTRLMIPRYTASKHCWHVRSASLSG